MISLTDKRSDILHILQRPPKTLSLLAAIILFCAFAIFYKHLFGLSRYRKLPYPPGPKRLPLVGNLFDLPRTHAAQRYFEWGRRYNTGILYANALGTDIVIVNELSIADELFTKRSSLYNDRPDIPVLTLLGWEFIVGLMPYGEYWRRHRRVCHQVFSQEASKNHYRYQLSSLQKMLRHFLDEPQRFDDHIKMMSVSISLLTMYGYEVQSLSDPVIGAADEGTSLGSFLLTPASTLNMFPFLRHIPSWALSYLPHLLVKDRKDADRVKKLTSDMHRIPSEWLVKALDGSSVSNEEQERAKNSFVGRFLEGKIDGVDSVGTGPTEEEIINNIAKTVYSAASDTTVSAVRTFMHMLATHTRIQSRAQQELDSVVGSDRLPDYSDRPNLPYIEAIYREVLRWNPPLATGAPHALMEDDIYNGYFLPKGAIVLGNIWAMTRDERLYPDPNTFKPERFLNEQGGLNDSNRVLAYGFGRRVCVGQHVGSNSVWLAIASVLACFELGKAKDDQGNNIDIDDEYLDLGIMSHKKPFKCSITPRSERIRKLILEHETDC